MIIDAHQHVGEAAHILGAAASDAGDDYIAWDAVQRAEACQAMGVSHVVVMPAFEYPTYDGAASIRAVNDRIAAYVQRVPLAVAALGIVDPLADPEPGAELERLVTQLGLAGLAMSHRFQRMPMNAKPMVELLAGTPSGTRVVALHCHAESKMMAPWRLAELALAFPHLNFLALSSLTSHTQCAEMLFLCRQAPNISVELAGLVPLGLWIERFVNELGSERLLFGSDLYVDPPIFRHCALPQLIDSAHIGAGDKENILYRNAIRLFGLPHDLT